MGSSSETSSPEYDFARGFSSTFFAYTSFVFSIFGDLSRFFHFEGISSHIPHLGAVLSTTAQEHIGIALAYRRVAGQPEASRKSSPTHSGPWSSCGDFRWSAVRSFRTSQKRIRIIFRFSSYGKANFRDTAMAERKERSMRFRPSPPRLRSFVRR